MVTKKQPTIAQVCAILDHDRCETSWLVVAYIDRGGVPRIDRLTRIGVVRPRDGAGRLRVVVTDWAGGDAGDPVQFVGSANGYGYDKLTAALDGASVGGRTVADHGGPVGSYSWKQWIDRLKYDHATPEELAPIRRHLGLPESAPLAFDFVGAV